VTRTSAGILQIRGFDAVNVYALGLASAALALLSGALVHGARLDAPIWIVIGLAGIAFLAERQSVRVTSHTQMSVSVLPILFAAVLYGPIAGMLVGSVALLADFGAPYVRWLVWTSQRALSAGLAGLAASALVQGSAPFGRTFAAVALAACTEAISDGCLMSATAIVRGNNFLETTHSIIRLQLGAVPLYTPVLAVIVFAYWNFSPWTVALFFAPAFAAQQLFRLYQEQRDLADTVVAANRRLERANLSFATALVATLDARDRYTAGHSAAVAVYSRDIAARMALSEEEQQLAHLCGLVHDIGKVGLPPGLLEKAGALTLEERRQMEKHPVIGQRILSKVEDYTDISRIVRHHHERVDGYGYPDGLAGDEIPLISRIIAVADAYNAMTSDRPYRDAMPSRVARLRLAQSVESQFDTSVVAAFEAILAGATESYRSGSRDDFTLVAQESDSQSPLREVHSPRSLHAAIG
jgi:putative nucleotidyltransferase with HDIG domain